LVYNQKPFVDNQTSVTLGAVSVRINDNNEYMKHRLVDVLIGIGIGISVTFAFTVKAERVTYTASETVVVSEPMEVLIETEEQKNERLVREAFPDAPIMVEVARCESEFKNVPGKLSDDFGIFQINHVHLKRLAELGLDRTNVEDNITYARMLYDEQGTQPWYSSEHCWSK